MLSLGEGQCGVLGADTTQCGMLRVEAKSAFVSLCTSVGVFSGKWQWEAHIGAGGLLQMGFAAAGTSHMFSELNGIGDTPNSCVFFYFFSFLSPYRPSADTWCGIVVARCGNTLELVFKGFVGCAKMVCKVAEPLRHPRRRKDQPAIDGLTPLSILTTARGRANGLCRARHTASGGRRAM